MFDSILRSKTNALLLVAKQADGYVKSRWYLYHGSAGDIIASEPTDSDDIQCSWQQLSSQGMEYPE